jgi:hypothetical protein
MPGRVCEKHERYVHEGEECPHCETSADTTPVFVHLHPGELKISTEALERLSRSWAAAYGNAAKRKP